MDAAPKDVAMVANPMKKAPATSPSGSGTPPALASPSSAVDAAASEASEDAVGLQAGLVKGDAASSSSSSATASRVAARVPRVPLVPPPTAPPPREEQAPARAAGFAFVMIGLLSALVALAAFAMALSATIAVAGQSNGAASAAAETTEAWGSHLADFTSLRGHMPLNFNQLADIPTAGARDSEWFTIDGELYLAFANDKDDYSTIWRFRRTDRAFVLVQRVATKNAHDVDVIALGGETYLTYGCKGGTTSSYKWTKSTSTFVHHQTLRDGLYIRDVDHFEYVGEHWLILVVSEKVDATSGDKTNSANSELFKWDASAKVWDFEQYLPSVGARDAEFYVVDNVGCIAIANTKGDPATIRTLNSNIYRWDGTRFVSTGAADIMTKGNYDFEYFEIQTRCKDAGTGVVRVENASFMAAAFSTDETGARSLDSKIYKWKGWSGGEWVEYQNIPTHGARDWEFFQLPTNEFSGADPSGVDLTGKEGTFASSGKNCPRHAMNDHNTWEYAHCINSFLAVSNLEYDNGDNDVDSVLYVWSQWTNRFEAIQTISTLGARDFDFVHDVASHSYMLSSASSKAGKSGPYETRSFVLDTLGLRVAQLDAAALGHTSLTTPPIPACV